MNYRDIITIEPDKRSGQPCIRGMRITVYDVLEYLAAGMTIAEVLDDFPYLTETDIRACLAYAADREKAQMVVYANETPLRSKPTKNGESPVGETSRSRCSRSAGALGCHPRIRAGFPRELHRQVMFLGPLGPTCL